MHYKITDCVKTTVSGAVMLYVKSMVCGVVKKFLEITLILKPACGDVKIGPARAYGRYVKDRLIKEYLFQFSQKTEDGF